MAFAEAGCSHMVITSDSERELQDVEATIAKTFPETKVTSIPCDITDQAAVDAFWSAVEQPVHCLVNTAG
jgi:NADP-dependent 3-hydroxy acid dehydrogenase YdfG